MLRGAFVLPEDALIVPVDDLPESVRTRIGDCAQEFALTRLNAREPSKLIDERGAGLIGNFREPRTIVQAVLRHARESGLDPETTLEESLPLLRQLIAAGMLVPEGDEAANRIEATLRPGDVVAGYRIVRNVQVLDDSELYQAVTETEAFVALKIARSDRNVAMRSKLAAESAALRRIAGKVVPEWVGEGEHDRRPFLATRWVSGTNAISAAEELQASSDRKGLLRLLRNVASSYSTLHALGVLHADVHAGNLLVGSDGEVTLVDFGLATLSDIGTPPERGGVAFYFEPEWARQLLADGSSVPASARGEQFAVAALLYLLATRQHYVDFTLEREEMLRQICDAPPLPFASRGVSPWPALEQTLCRALSKDPAARFPDMAAFSAALDACVDADLAVPTATPRHDGRKALVASMIDFLDIDGSLFRDGLPHAPLCSVNLGAAGIAYALLRLAQARDEPRWLSLADAWLIRAEADVERDDAFANTEMELTPGIVGRVSPFHGEPGLHAVRALLDAASGDVAACGRAAAAFSHSIEQPCIERDLVFGRCGSVLASAMLLEGAPVLEATIREALVQKAGTCLNQLWLGVEDFDVLHRARGWRNLGAAHGWAGLLHATQRFCAAADWPVPERLHDRLEQLFACARPQGRGLEWPWRQVGGDAHDAHESSMPGWCNGAAGMTHVACNAYAQTGDARWLERAEGAGWQTWEAGGGPVDLCCGLAGRAYSLLELYRSTGDSTWKARAHALMDFAIKAAAGQRSQAHPRHSLFKGELGLVVLAMEIKRPECASMPMFGEEGRA